MVRPEVKKKRRDMASAAVQSKKARKKLEKVVLRKRLKVDRSNVLAQLKKVQLQPDQLAKLHSTSSMQTRGLKRFTNDTQVVNGLALSKADQADECLDATILINRKRRKLKPNLNDKIDSASSSEDTDAVSTDTEIYEYKDDKEEKMIEPEPEPKPEISTECPRVGQEKRLQQESHKKCIDKIKSEPAVYVPVTREPDVEKARLELPIIGEEQRIMEEIRYNDIVIISGETGSGKTTQLPQFLYEAGYTLNGKLIGITEPRRVAAVAMSDRVAHELNLTGKDDVAYQIRFAGTVSLDTRIKFMTDGVLLRECQNDFLLSKYSVIIIDEAHERSVFSDILIGLLSRIVPLRSKRGNPLKLVIMSATLRVTDFIENSFLFPKVPPVIKIDARQFPVTVRFARETPKRRDYLQAAYKKVCSIHNKMPRGGILVFVTSQMDVKALCKKLQKKSMLFCLGLYAMLPLEKQKLVFNRPPEGSRLCVIATNVAETSITIPNIKYVVDTGLEKKKLYDLFTGVSRFVTSWTSKSSAEQRKGRAGRVGPGYCFRLYSSAVYTNDFPEHSEVQILQKPVEDVLLQMKSMNIDNVVNFPFPTRPSIEALKAAEKKLIILGALDDSKIKTARFEDISKTEYSSRPTALGKAMSKFAVSARCSKMIVLSPHDLLARVTSLVAALTVREMFLSGNQYRELRKKWVGHGNSRCLGDFMLMIKAVSLAESFGCSEKSCLKNGLRWKAMLEIDKLRKQLTHEINHELGNKVADSQVSLKKPSEAQCKILCQLLLSSFCDHVARRIPDGEIKEKKTNDPEKPEKKRLRHAYECMETDEPVYIDSESVLKGDHPEYLIYRELYKGDRKMYMRDVAVIEPGWLPFYAPKLCNFGDISANTTSYPPRYDALSDQIVCKRVTTYGPLNWPLGIVDVPMHLVETGTDIYKHFACFLFSGDILDWFKKHSSKLLSPPSIMTKPWSKLQPRTSKTLQALLSANVKTKKDLLKAWKNDPLCK